MDDRYYGADNSTFESVSWKAATRGKAHDGKTYEDWDAERGPARGPAHRAGGKAGRPPHAPGATTEQIAADAGVSPSEPWTMGAGMGPGKPDSPFPWWCARGGGTSGVDPDAEGWIGEHIAELASWVDWLCAWDQEVDDTLPSCWANHPFLVMCMDALRTLWYGSWSTRGAYNGPVYFLQAVDSTLGQMRRWMAATNSMPGDHECHPHDTTVSSARMARRRSEEDAGIHPDRAWVWPPNEPRDQALARLARTEDWGDPEPAPDGGGDGDTV